MSRYIIKIIYLEKLKCLIICNEEITKPYIMLISSKILAHARAQVDGLVALMHHADLAPSPPEA